MCLTVCLRRFAVTDALCAVQDPRKMPGQAAQKRAAKAMIRPSRLHILESYRDKHLYQFQKDARFGTVRLINHEKSLGFE